ncbi:hypothetical protein GCM10023144_03590 [Pigmentiphaga soli]|uniref:DUF2486 family protein n=1 Tax=Pigmentiphaga soli TaxID=1007095 RepID=A0ABP8GEW3_9BURK
MPEPVFRSDDPAIPVLTDVIDMPPSPPAAPASAASPAGAEAAERAAAATRAIQIDIPEPPSAAADDAAGAEGPSAAVQVEPDAQAQPHGEADETPDPAGTAAAADPDLADDPEFAALRTAVLKDLHQRLQPVLRDRMRHHIDAAIRLALSDVRAGLEEELGRLVDEALHKELIREAARQEPLRGKPPADDGAV